MALVRYLPHASKYQVLNANPYQEAVANKFFLILYKTTREEHPLSHSCGKYNKYLKATGDFIGTCRFNSSLAVNKTV